MDEDGRETAAELGKFKPCGVCGTQAAYGRSSVQDHQTKGDQPFQALVTRQIKVQPPGGQPATKFAPLRGRKVLAFSDSRQTAARLAPNLQRYSMQDVLRPLILRGWHELEEVDALASSLCLDHLYLAVLVGAHRLSVRLRPELKEAESLRAMDEVSSLLERGALTDTGSIVELITISAQPPPHTLLRGIVDIVNDRYFGLQSLALASVRERRNLDARLHTLPDLPGVAATEQQKLALTRLWIAQWTKSYAGIMFAQMTPGFFQVKGGVKPHSGNFASLNRWLPDKATRTVFQREWLPVLAELLCEAVPPKTYRLRAANLALDLSGEWGYCGVCRTTQRPFPSSNKCENCGREAVNRIDPDTDSVFAARKAYYRDSSVRALLEPPDPPLTLVAAEHTAQLNSAQADDVFSKAETHELLFQDLDIGLPAVGEQQAAAIDVLSCTTTMEVGIDIGTLSGVALRNMPPSRANYQQRAGRAGRRGNAVATVVAFGSADSHDEHYFSEPSAMIRGDVEDPVVTLDNVEIAQRHVTAFLLQGYHQARLPTIAPEAQPQLFEVLGSVGDFLGTASPLNRRDFESWLRESEVDLVEAIRDWLPHELSAENRDSLLAKLVEDTLSAIDMAVPPVTGNPAPPVDAAATDDQEADTTLVETPAEGDEAQTTPRRTIEKLLDRLLYKGVLPRYAFPTDVVSFYVFDRERSTRFRTEFRYAPSQGLPMALSQYAPGKDVWIDGKLWTSGALYSQMPKERFDAWQERRLYLECAVCRYACTETQVEATRGEVRDCPACGAVGEFGAAKNWIRPPGFAHPHQSEEVTSADDQPERSYATRAKLEGPTDAGSWETVTPQIRQYHQRTHLLVSNSGPRGEGYSYCFLCGVIEPTATPVTRVVGQHPKPYPDEREPDCRGGRATHGLVLGTDFISDVLLVSLRVEPPLTLRPQLLTTQIVLRTIAEALTRSATKRLGIEARDLQAEYRPALTPGGQQGSGSRDLSLRHASRWRRVRASSRRAGRFIVRGSYRASREMPRRL